MAAIHTVPAVVRPPKTQTVPARPYEAVTTVPITTDASADERPCTKVETPDGPRTAMSRLTTSRVTGSDKETWVTFFSSRLLLIFMMARDLTRGSLMRGRAVSGLARACLKVDAIGSTKRRWNSILRVVGCVLSQDGIVNDILKGL